MFKISINKADLYINKWIKVVSQNVKANISLDTDSYSILIHRLRSVNENVQLTMKETEILSFVVSGGHTSKEIARIFNISPRTVDTHIEHIKDKLCCYSKSDIRDLIHSKDMYHVFQKLYSLLRKKLV